MLITVRQRATYEVVPFKETRIRDGISYFEYTIHHTQRAVYDLEKENQILIELTKPNELVVSIRFWLKIIAKRRNLFQFFSFLSIQLNKLYL